MRKYTQLLDGRKLWIESFDKGQFSVQIEKKDGLIDVLMHQLSRIVRFSGAIHFDWTVLDHSLLMTELAEDLSDKTKAICLLHDAHEVVVGDAPSPAKEFFPKEYKLISEAFDRCLGNMFNFGTHNLNLVKDLDNMSLNIEAYLLTSFGWGDALNHSPKVNRLLNTPTQEKIDNAVKMIKFGLNLKEGEC
jgi:hypothetical protein